jgi:hypothetical protein
MTSSSSELLERFGVGVQAFLDRAGKAQHTSSMFDLRRRTLIGCYCYLEHLPWVLARLDELTTPATLGASGRGLCGSPFGPQIHGLLWGYLLARENELGLEGDPGSDLDLEHLLEWWAGMAEAYRQDGALLPEEGGDRQPAAANELIAEVMAEHGRPAAELPGLGRMTTALQLYNYILRGEQRGTTYYHGPYAGVDGSTLIVEEFTRLRHNELPWNPEPAPLPFDGVAAVLAVDEVAFEFDLFAGMRTRPADYRPHVRAVAILACDGGAPRPLAEDEVTALTDAALVTQRELFRAMIGWTPEFRVAYGAFHYLDFLVPFLDAAGADPGVIGELRERFAQTMQARLGPLIEMESMPVWDRLFAHRDPIFTPLSGQPSNLGRQRC